ncbi:DsbA family protein [Virgibacillus necropolis]|uniref:Dihydroneopterin aldolase n=1 Tax=Virgibacillus necropolis TaxID=163877 RepID=A0A221MDF6_9BACI|nr:DsbA family protein [Virgibacillus necropolis]ASN05642.1 dihydroneopterin aldolase [Virgibacillus necropolis]
MKSENSPFKTVVIITLVIVALIIAFVVINNNSSESNVETTSDKQPSIVGQPTLGDSDAPVTVVEFGDFKCPACKVWGTDIFPQLIRDYVETGKVKFSFINVLFHGEESKLGSLAAESVYQQNPDAYWDFHKALFKAQPSENHDSEWITIEKILEVASSVPNIDADKLKMAIENNSEMNEVNKDTKLVTDFEIQLTPTIMVNGTMIEDPYDYEAIKQAIEKALEEN